MVARVLRSFFVCSFCVISRAFVVGGVGVDLAAVGLPFDRVALFLVAPLIVWL